ncbi:hypothetical protein [Streptomyces sp. C10-9-1]|uniref:hypothetical protein n=1 Tax=Streptomyces sp. C10-9-1 TaxID=1859285 RepID=UPI003F49D28A
MISKYAAWGGNIRHGEIHYALYDEMLEFVNFRAETADSCLTLIENRKIADSLGLSRSLLEHYLLFVLMCRGRKYFQLQDLSSLTRGSSTSGSVRSKKNWKKSERPAQHSVSAYASIPERPQGISCTSSRE